ncbi:MAG: S41 family peptidase [Rhodospirillales bacterium]
MLFLTLLGLLQASVAAPGFDVKLAAHVFAAALAFTAPRVLDPVTPADLTLWGLHGITAIDPSLSTDRHGTLVRLTTADRLVLTRPAPPADDANGWGRVAAEINDAAYATSTVLRQAGFQAMLQSFFDEMFNHLDPYSRYVPPTPAEAARSRLSVDAGAGLHLLHHKGGLAVSDVVPGGPGAAAGARVGDRILSVNGRDVRAASADHVQSLLTGAEGGEVAVRVRGLDGATRTLLLTLAYVPPETVFSTRDQELQVVRVTAFDGNTAERLSQALEAAMVATPPPAALVIDLRGNRGGLLRQAVTAVALLAEQGVIASTAGRDPQATHDWRIDGGGDLTHGMKLLLLVDANTASAAEIMAAALADLGRGVVIGSATLGKGLVQTITRLPDSGELYVTWSRVLAPKSWPIQTLGVMPQVCTSRGAQDLHRQLDDLAAGHWDLADAVGHSRSARAPLPMAQALELRQPCPAAEGSDADMAAAHFLATHPIAYHAALLR